MTTSDLVPIPQTQRNNWPGTSPADEISSDAGALLTAWLRPKRGGDLDVDRARAIGSTIPRARTYAERGDLARATSADPADVDRLKTYCADFGIEVVGTHWRCVTLSGPLRQLIRAFDATVAMHETPDKRRFRHRSRSLHAPPEIAAMLRGIFGLHQWPRSRAIAPLQGQLTPLSAHDIAARYAFPDADGSGQTIGVLQLRGTFNAGDFTKGMQLQGVAARMPLVKRVDDAELAHAEQTAKDVESAIDAQIVGSLAPGAQIVVYAAPDDERGVLDAVRTALFDEESRPSVLSISFGFPEFLWTPAALTILDELFTAAALLGVSVFCASGDNGAEMDYDGNPHVLAPASCQFVHGCGGTRIRQDAAQSAEIAWEKTGGGFSARFEAPPWQTEAGAVATAQHARPGRGVPDVAAQVTPGYGVFFDDAQIAMGGTSAVAPMWSALAARLNQRLGHPIGFCAPLLYAGAKTMFSPIVTGDNGRFQSAPGWDPCTGLGTPVGTAIEKGLAGESG